VVARAFWRAVVKGSAIEVWIRILSVAMQIWPDWKSGSWLAGMVHLYSGIQGTPCLDKRALGAGGRGHTFKKAPAKTPWTAVSRSAPWHTIELFFPPSSMRQGLRFWPQDRAILRPTAVLPVKLILRTAGCSIIAFTTSAASVGRQWMIFRHPAGRPASSKARPMAQ
jgi:hypothetical protein